MPNNSYVYRARTIPVSEQPPSYVTDVATTLFFADDPIVASGTMIKATHITQLRTALNLVRSAAGLAPFSFTDPNLAAGSIVKAVHIQELCTALNEARSVAGASAITYANAISAGVLVR